MNTFVTIIMPVYNTERFLKEAVGSVLKQTYQNWELLLLDDCSEDNSLKIAREFEGQDNRIRVVQSERNVGVARVRNKGIQMAKGDYIALLDSDDVWLPDKLERQLKLMQSKGAQISYCSYDFIDEQSQPMRKPFLVPESTNYQKMLGSSVISCSTALIERTLLQAHLFNPEFYHEDYVLWMELLSVPGVKAVGETAVLARYRQVTGSRSNDKGNSAKERWKIYRRVLHMGAVSSAWAFVRYAVNGVRKYYVG